MYAYIDWILITYTFDAQLHYRFMLTIFNTPSFGAAIEPSTENAHQKATAGYVPNIVFFHT